MAPQVGLEPTTLRLTAECSAIELLRNMGSGGDLLSRAVTSQVPSALKGLTSVFGMGTGGTPSSLPPEMVSYSIQPPTGAPRSRSSLFRLFRSLLLSLSERSAPSIVLFFLFRGPRIAFRNPDNCTAVIQEFVDLSFFSLCFQLDSRSFLKSSPRPISIIKLHALPHFHR